MTRARSRVRSAGPLLVLWLLLFSSASAHGLQDEPGSSQPDPDQTEADQPDPGSVTGELSLLGQSAYVAADGEFVATLAWTGPTTPDLNLTTVIRARVDREAQLQSSRGTLNRLDPIPLIQATSGPGEITIRIPVRSFSPAAPDDPDRILIPDAGVYPIEIAITDSFGTVASLQSSFIHLPTDTTEREASGVAMVIPISPSEGLDIEAVIGLLDAHPEVPLTVLIDSAAQSLLIADEELSERLAQALGDRDVMATNGVDLDPSALARIGHGDLFTTTTADSQAALAEVGLTPSTSILPLEPDLTDDGATLLVDNGVGVVLDLEGDSQGAVEVAGGTLQLVAPDRVLTDALGDTEDPVMAAHQVLARLAVRSEDGQEFILVGGPDLNAADPATLDILLSAFGQIGPVEAVTLEGYADQRPRLMYRTRESPAQDLVAVSATVDRIAARIGLFSEFFVSGSEGPESHRNALISALSRDRNPDDRVGALEQLSIRLDEALGTIAIQDGQSVTLTARRIAIPLTIENTSDGDRSIRLDFDSDKIEVDEDGQVVTVPPGVSSLQVTLEARSIGVSPLTVQARTPDASFLLSQSQLRVRSTAVPGLGLLLSGAAITFLVSWWIVSATRSRASKRDQADPDETEPTPADPVPVGTGARRPAGGAERRGINVGEEPDGAPSAP